MGRTGMAGMGDAPQALLPRRLRARNYEQVALIGLAPEAHEADDVQSWMRPRPDMPLTRASLLQRWSGLSPEEFEACFACTYALDRPVSRALRNGEVVCLAQRSLRVILRHLPHTTPVIVLGSELMQALPSLFVNFRRALGARWYSFPPGKGRLVAWMPDTVCSLEGYVWWHRRASRLRAQEMFRQIADIVVDYGGDHKVDWRALGLTVENVLEFEAMRTISPYGLELIRAEQAQREADKALGPLWQRKRKNERKRRA